MAEFWATHSRLHKVVMVLVGIATVAALRSLVLHDAWVVALVGATLMWVGILVVNAIVVRPRTPVDERPPMGLSWDEHHHADVDESA